MVVEVTHSRCTSWTMTPLFLFRGTHDTIIRGASRYIGCRRARAGTMRSPSIGPTSSHRLLEFSQEFRADAMFIARSQDLTNRQPSCPPSLKKILAVRVHEMTKEFQSLCLPMAYGLWPRLAFPVTQIRCRDAERLQYSLAETKVFWSIHMPKRGRNE